MASVPVPVTNVGSGYTIITQVLPSSTASTTAEQNSTQTHSPLSKFLKGEPKALGMNIINVVPNPEVYVPVENSSSAHPMNIINVVPNPEVYVPVENSSSAHPVKVSVVMNVISVVAAVVAAVVFSIDLNT
ncbi:hypothetical protein Q7C36_005319 [Tachysurus vachellii]|uniref:Uncharacterized protein n=1 Tax=Tachysurus vachellii TaxID=175792 RepID=A0AA88NDM7_TACVA|nr:hypothetical protein Q7C36_005319 [Tachysurus vachellii]